LGIWAVKETIALRNILLICGTIITFYYIMQQSKEDPLKKQLNFWKAVPLCLIPAIFVWVIAHYFFFSIDPKAQLEELKSTWFRSFLASIVGFGTGLTLRKYPNRLGFLWVGILISFIVLLYQYFPRALIHQKLLVLDYEYYLFHLKINVVLMGTILLVGIDGALFDYLRISQNRKILTSFYILYWIFGTLIVFWAFVFIVDSRNGMGLSILIHIFWILCATLFLIKNKQWLSIRNSYSYLFLLVGLLIVIFFFKTQVKINSGWATLINDAKIAVQIHHYPNWQNIPQMGYPVDSNGQTVTQNNYQRIAWATAGAYALLHYPQGAGVLSLPFLKILKTNNNIFEDHNNIGMATHSGWIELGLAFGIPILISIFLIVLITFINTIINPYPAKMTVLGITFLVTCLYAIGEVAINHGLEILFYLLTLIQALILVEPKKISAD
jgi:hypothetical protein